MDPLQTVNICEEDSQNVEDEEGEEVDPRIQVRCLQKGPDV